VKEDRLLRISSGGDVVTAPANSIRNGLVMWSI